MDCGACDFCKDKAKFGGCNTLRQKCLWKQCLQFASKRLLPRELLGGQSPWPDWKEQGYRSGRRHWKENIFASRKVARVIQVARKRKIWQASAQAPEVETVGEEPSESADWADPTRAETLEAAESSQARTESPQRSVDTAEDKVITPGTPEKPFLKAPESHDRPSVIKQTSSEQTRRQPVEVTPTVVKRDTAETDPESIPTPRPISETEAAPHRSVSPVIKQRDGRERHCSRKALLLSSQEAEAKDLSTRIVPPVIQEGATEPASTHRPPASPKRAAEPEVRASGVPSNSRIIGGATPEQNPGYGRSTPAAITQIFSLGSPYMMMTLEPLLRNFMQELMVMPLPASWVVCSSLGPDVQLIQLSRKSPVSDAVVQIRPGFFFHVLVRGLPVPLGHRLYRSHPAQLTTVDDVVDLISDLETYRVCAGYPQLRNAKPPPAAVAALLPRERSSYCEVLVDKDRCFQCAITL
ncbi:methyl-CpG-binding domain protein 1a isoform X2 [Cetorhinus maximus]